MKKTLATVALVVSASLFAAQPQGAEKTDRADKDKVEMRAKRMVKNATALFETGEEDRAIGMLEAVWRMEGGTDPDNRRFFDRGALHGFAHARAALS